MSDPLTISVVIVSRHRPDALRRCLRGVAQLRYPAFEVVVVADPQGLAMLRGLPQAAQIKQVAFDQANISAARNLGLAQAAGRVVAFIDDDSVPEPLWLTHLAAAFADPQVTAAGGFVRGRNGISFQSRAASVDCTGGETALQVDPDRITVLTARPGLGIKTEGTNMAIRRGVLARIGGFDPRYRFFLDETDLNLRLAEIGAQTAIVPPAEVHHGFAASARRRDDRVPCDLTEIGASWAVFLVRHCPEDRRAAVWAEIRAGERTRALTHMVAGRLEPRDVRRLLAGLDAGFAEGARRNPEPMPSLPAPAAPFLSYPVRADARSLVFAGRFWRRRPLRQAARAAAAAGNVATVIRLSPTALYHQLRFTPDGIWEQSGGLFGRSDRDQPVFTLWRFSSRIRAEIARVARQRGLGGSSRAAEPADGKMP